MLRRREAELAHVGRLGMLGEAVAEIAHEINQPLFSIHNFSQACLSELAKPAGGNQAEIVGWLERIRTASSRASQILRRITGFVRSGERSVIDCSVNDLLTDTLELISWRISRQRIDVDVRPAPPGLRFQVDRTQIQQVLMNLLLNACDAIEQSQPLGAGRIAIEANDTDGVIQFVVEDNGPGVPDDVRDRLFEPFVSTKQDGMGMGLAICRSIVERHGGKIAVVKDAGNGARFTVTIPKRPGQQAA
ncbi:MAG: hypothetical protein CMJ58_21880 [Planctomycetaceae bacterium]|nr:hypothetical protein [Planctomycetaceae bacterium]